MKITEILELRRMGYTKAEIDALREEERSQPTVQPDSDPQPIVQPDSDPQPTVQPDSDPGTTVIDRLNALDSNFAALNSRMDEMFTQMHDTAIRQSAQPETPARSDIDILGEFLVPKLEN